MEQSIRVWLICVDGENKDEIALQRRAEADGWGRFQSHPFVFQAAVDGKVSPGEDLMRAIKRVAREELGETFANVYNFEERLTPFYTGKYRDGEKKGRSHSFLGLVKDAELKLIDLHKRAFPEFLFVSSSDFKKIKCFSERLNPGEDINPRRDVVLFRDQWKALKNLFELKEKLKFWP